MNKTISIKGFIHAKPAESWQEGMADVHDGLQFVFFTIDEFSSSGYSLVGPYTMTIEIPDGWDPRPGQIKALEKRKEELTNEFRKAVSAINSQLAKLQAIEFTEAG